MRCKVEGKRLDPGKFPSSAADNGRPEEGLKEYELNFSIATCLQRSQPKIIYKQGYYTLCAKLVREDPRMSRDQAEVVHSVHSTTIRRIL